MAKFSKKEFAGLCGIETKNLSVYVTRGKVIVDSDGTIDGSNEHNKTFLMKQSSKKRPVPEETTKKEKEVVTQPKLISEMEETAEYSGLEIKKTAAQVEKLQQEVRLLKIKEEKLQGVVVPSDLILPVFLQHNQSIITEVHNESIEFVRLFVKKNGLSIEEEAQIKGSVIKWFNGAITRATEMSKVSVKNIIKGYANNRGVGERD